MRRAVSLTAFLTMSCFALLLDPAVKYTDAETRALKIAGEVYGWNFLPSEPPRVSIAYHPPTCSDQYPYMPGFGEPGFKTSKANCTVGAVAAYSTHIDVVTLPDGSFSSVGMCRALYQLWEMGKFGLPDVYNSTPRWQSGEASASINRCVAGIGAP